jgi:hypothetical protein
MTGRARLPGLACVKRKRDGTPRRQANNEDGGDRRAADHNRDQHFAMPSSYNMQHLRKPPDHANLPL